MPDKQIPSPETLTEAALRHGAFKAGVVPVADIPFDAAFRDACRQNTCGKYGSCYICPPDCGDIHEMMAEAQKRQLGFIFQTVTALEDSYDFEGMMEAGHRHQRVAEAIWAEWLPVLPHSLGLGAGSCNLCEVCGKVTGEACRHPGRTFPSVEAYGVNVSQLAPLCGMKYINGQDTVTYFSGILYGGG